MDVFKGMYTYKCNGYKVGAKKLSDLSGDIDAFLESKNDDSAEVQIKKDGKVKFNLVWTRGKGFSPAGGYVTK